MLSTGIGTEEIAKRVRTSRAVALGLRAAIAVLSILDDAGHPRTLARVKSAQNLPGDVRHRLLLRLGFGEEVDRFISNSFCEVDERMQGHRLLTTLYVGDRGAAEADGLA